MFYEESMTIHSIVHSSVSKNDQRLIFYATKGDCAGVERMLDEGADIQARAFATVSWSSSDASNPKIWLVTPLHLACIYGKSDAVQLLLEKIKKANREIDYDLDPIMNNPLSVAIRTSIDTERSVSLLLQYDKKMDLPRLQSALHDSMHYKNVFAVRSILKFASKDFDPKLQALLLSWLPKDLATIVVSYHIGECPQLVDQQADNANNYSPLGWSAILGNEEIVKLLLDSRANPCTLASKSLLRNRAFNTSVVGWIKKNLFDITPAIKKLILDAAPESNVSHNTRSRKRKVVVALEHADPKRKK